MMKKMSSPLELRFFFARCLTEERFQCSQYPLRSLLSCFSCVDSSRTESKMMESDIHLRSQFYQFLALLSAEGWQRFLNILWDRRKHLDLSSLVHLGKGVKTCSWEINLIKFILLDISLSIRQWLFDQDYHWKSPLAPLSTRSTSPQSLCVTVGLMSGFNWNRVFALCGIFKGVFLHL